MVPVAAVATAMQVSLLMKYIAAFCGLRSNDNLGYARQEREELPLPDKPPYTAHLGNLSYDANQEAVTEFFTAAGCSVVSVRIVEDRAEMRPKGFGYAEFTTVDDLKKALELNEESFFSRNIRIRVADPRTSSHHMNHALPTLTL